MIEWGHADDLVVAGHSFRLTLFGNFSLCTADGKPITGLSRKAKGLIAYLALTRRVVGRDSLAELLWEGRGVEQARASLRQACYELRHHLPTDVPLLVFDREEIRLIHHNLTSDIDDLEATLAGLLAVMAPSRSELLRDLNGLSPAFDEWLRVERSRLDHERRAIALDAACHALADRRWSEAKGIAGSLLTLDPTDEKAMDIALRALSESGSLKEAQALYSRHTNALWHELNVRPAASTATLFADLARAHRAGNARPAARNGPSPRDDLPLPAHGEPDPVRTSQIREYGGLTVLIGVGVAALLVGGARFREVRQTPQLPLVKVEQLSVPASDEQAQAVSAGLRSSLVQKLAGTETPVQVVDAAAKSSGQPALIVRGNSMTDHGQLRANVELVAGSSGQVLWATTLDRPASEIDQFEEQLSLQVAHELHCAYADGRAPYFARDLEFARLSLSHCDTIGLNFEESQRFDAEITRRAPGFARGWAEYGMDTALGPGDIPPLLEAANRRRSETYVERALALDPKQGLAYAALLANRAEAPWQEREHIALEGLAADPTSPELHFHLAQNLSSIGRLDDALGQAKLAYQYDHFLPGKVLGLALLEILTGDADDASDGLAIGRKYWPGHPWFDYLALRLGLAGSQPAEALKLVTSGRIRVSPARAHVLEAFLRWRISPSAANNATAVTAIQLAARENGVTDQQVQLLAMLNHSDAAYRLADSLKLNPTGDSSDWFDPELARFRSDPRFMRLAARLGIAQVWWQTGLWPDFCMQGSVSKCRAEVAGVLAAKGSALASNTRPGRPRLLASVLRASRAEAKPGRSRSGGG